MIQSGSETGPYLGREVGPLQFQTPSLQAGPSTRPDLSFCVGDAPPHYG